MRVSLSRIVWNLLVVCAAGLALPARADWRPSPASPIFRGDAKTAYRDPAALWADGRCHLFFTLVETEDDGAVHSYVACSESRDLQAWTKPRKITPKSDRDYSSPGDVVRDGDEWVLCLQSYPRPGNRNDGKVRYADGSARLFTMRSKDLVRWSAPELLRVKGPDVAEADMGRMIDPYLVRDGDGWICFYKQNGASFSRSRDLRTWEYVGRTDAGENVCIVREGDAFTMVHSPHNGMRLKTSSDLLTWTDVPGEITLGQSGWPWARGRLTAGFALDAREVPGVGGWALFFHGSGPRAESEGDFDRNASIGMAFADSLRGFMDPRPLRVLAIGNSYTQSLLPEFPKVAKAAGCKLDLAIFAIGGKTLSNHWMNCEAALADPAHRPYVVNGRRTNLPEMLSEGRWDVVTLQEQSADGMRPEKFDPWADRLIACIRARQPQARILFQLTWSDTVASPRISDRGVVGSLKMTQDEMYAALERNYLFQARRFGVGVIPVGKALQLYRQALPVTLQKPTKEEIKALRPGEDLDCKGELSGWWAWSKGRTWEKDYGVYRLRRDFHHLNPEGQYLQACAWTAALFDVDLTDLPYAPDLGADFARRAPLMRRCARQAAAWAKTAVSTSVSD